MNSKNNLLLLLGSFFVLTAGCTTSKENSLSVELPILTGENTGSMNNADTKSGEDKPHLLPRIINTPLLNQHRTGSSSGFYINDKNRKGYYRNTREFMLLRYMGIQAADLPLGYQSGYIYVDIDIPIRFQIDEKTFIIYYNVLSDPNYYGTGVLNIVKDKPSYKVCKDGFDMQKEEVIYDREKYEALLKKNPMRCFGEDKTYVYGRREYKKSEEGGYELMRIRK